MTKTEPISSAPVLAAIDISKHRHEVLIEVPGRKRRRRVTVLNKLDEFNRLIELLSVYNCPVRVAFEATGNYHRALAWHLSVAGFETKLISSVALARTREALHNSWDKNDPKDAQVILHMMSIGAGPKRGKCDVQKPSLGCARDQYKCDGVKGLEVSPCGL